MSALNDAESPITLRSCIQKVASGPEYSKDLAFDEARAAMHSILSAEAEPVQAAVLLIGLRMKREIDAENKGILQGIIDMNTRIEAPVDELVDVADPYDGFTHGFPASTCLPAALAACGAPARVRGLESVGQ